MADNDLSTIEEKLDKLLSLANHNSKENKPREWLIILVTAAVTFLFSTISQSLVTYYSHRQDRGLEMAKQQINALTGTMTPGPGGPAGDLREFANYAQMLSIMPTDALKVWAMTATGKCYNNLSNDCLLMLATNINAMRRSVGLSSVPPEAMVKVFQSDGVVDRLRQDFKESGP